MARYMKVILKKEHQNDLFIHLLNKTLSGLFGANSSNKFNAWSHLQEEADYLNTHQKGVKLYPDIKRPLTKEMIERCFHDMHYGTFSFTLTGDPTSDEARDAVAVCKWIIATRRKFIDQSTSFNYDRYTLKQYLDKCFTNAGYDLNALWAIPTLKTDKR